MEDKYHKKLTDMSYEELLCLIGATEEERAKIYALGKKIGDKWHGRN